MLLSLWLVSGRFFRPEYMNGPLLLLAALNVRLACLLVGAAELLPLPARDCLVGALAVATPPMRRADDDTSTSSSSSARPGGRDFSNHEEEEESDRLVLDERRNVRAMMYTLHSCACTPFIHQHCCKYYLSLNPQPPVDRETSASPLHASARIPRPSTRNPHCRPHRTALRRPSGC